MVALMIYCAKNTALSQILRTMLIADCRLVLLKTICNSSKQYLAQQQSLKEAQEKEKNRQQSTFMLGMGLRMMSGQSASGAAIDQSVGAPMYSPAATSPTRSYTFSNGRTMTCTTTGSFTDCF